MIKLPYYLGLFLLLVGCATSKSPQATSPAMVFTQTSQPSLLKPTLPAPTLTTYPADTATQTARPSLTPIPSATPNLAATVVAAQQPRLYASYPSPDGLWRADILTYDCVQTTRSDEVGWNENAYEEILLVSRASEEKQVAADQLIYCGGLGAYGFDGRYWSTNSRYFYYTTARQGVPDGCGYWQPPLSRLDVTGLASPQDLGISSLSPDGQKLASWNWPPKTLTVWNIDDGEILQAIAREPEAEIGPVTWSPDNRSLVYLQVSSWCPLSGKSYLVLVDIDSTQQALLLESESPTFGSVRWDTSNELSLFDENGNGWNFNLDSRKLTKAGQ